MRPKPHEPPALAFGSRSSVFKERPGTHLSVEVPGTLGADGPVGPTRLFPMLGRSANSGRGTLAGPDWCVNATPGQRATRRAQRPRRAHRRRWCRRASRRKRQGRSTSFVRPIRGPATITSSAAGPPEAPRRTGEAGSKTSTPSSERSIPSPWQSLPGPSAPRGAPPDHGVPRRGARPRSTAAPRRRTAPERGSAADHVRAAVQPVAQVDVQAPGWAEHGGVGHPLAAVGVARGVVSPAVGLDLGEPHDDVPGDELRAEQGPGDLVGGAIEVRQVHLGAGVPGSAAARVAAASIARRAARAGPRPARGPRPRGSCDG